MDEELEKSIKNIDLEGDEILNLLNNNFPPKISKIFDEIINKSKNFSEEVSILCGFNNIYLKDKNTQKDFLNGKPLRSYMFNIDLHSLLNKTSSAVFAPDGNFVGLIEKDENGKIKYKFVIN